MKIEKKYRNLIDKLLQERGLTVIHITGIRYGDCKDSTNAFIQEIAQKRHEVRFLPDPGNKYDHEAVSCRYGRISFGHVAVYDLEKYHILAEKNDTDQLTGYCEPSSANIEDHLLMPYIPDVVTMDDISDYRKKIDGQKDALYGSWQHDAIDPYLVRSPKQADAIAFIHQMKENVLRFFEGSSTLNELTPVFEDYKEYSLYDISLEGQRDRWDIVIYLDCFDYLCHQPVPLRDALHGKQLEDVGDIISQVGGELGRIANYKDYIDRLKELVTKLLPSSDTAKHYLNTLPPEAFDNIRRQVDKFPHYLYHLFRTDPEAFVKTLYYARIPRRYLDPFLSGIALVQAYDKIHSSTESMSLADDSKPFNKDVTNSELKVIYNGLEEHKMLCDNPSLEDFIYWNTGRGSRPQSCLKWSQKNVCRYFVQRYHDSDWATAEQCFLCRIGNINNLKSASNIKDDNKKIIDKILKEAREKGRKNHD